VKRARTVTGWLLLGLLGGAVAQGCGSSVSPKHNSSSGANAGTAGNDGTSTTVQPVGNGGGGGESEYNSLCGIPDTNPCVPDFDTNAVCLEVVGGRSGSSGGGKGGAGGNGAATATGGRGAGGSMSSPAGAGGESGTDASEGGMSQGGVGAAAGESASNGAQSGQGGETSGGAGQSALGGEPGEPGEPGSGGSATTSGTSGTTQASAGRAGGAAQTASSSCQVIESPNHKGLPLATCRPAGTGTEGSPCFSGADCAPKFACVGGGPGQCRAYCCSGPEQCQAYTGTHCAIEPLVPDPDAKSTRVLEVPVCMPAVKCSLAEQYPCPDGTCSCPAETACVVVTDDGTTSCVPVSELPSEDEGGETKPCPCARGYVCSQASHTCVKLCEVAAAGLCDGRRCQASPALPAGWGTCVGVAPKDAGAP
jgi:hypothetical protein